MIFPFHVESKLRSRDYETAMAWPVQIQLTLKDVRRAQRTNMGLGYFLFPVMGSMTILTAIFLFWIQMSTAIGIGLVAAGAFLVFIVPIWSRQQFKANKNLAQPFVIEASGEGIAINSEHGQSFTKWSAFLGFKESEEAFLLYLQPQLYWLFPKRFFSPEQLQELGDLVCAQVTRKKGGGRETIRQ
jgi:hypothetical protein